MILVKDNPANLLQWKDDVGEIVDRVEGEEWGWEFKTIGGKITVFATPGIEPSISHKQGLGCTAKPISSPWTNILYFIPTIVSLG